MEEPGHREGVVRGRDPQVGCGVGRRRRGEGAGGERGVRRFGPDGLPGGLEDGAEAAEVGEDHGGVALEVGLCRVELSDGEQDLGALGMGRTRSGLWTIVPSGSVTSWSRTPRSLRATNRTVTRPMGESTVNSSPWTVASPEARPAAHTGRCAGSAAKR
ncbi:hypothetical protein ACFSSF_08190 [Dietzia aerolata]|uniref:hypothetical protein n=1 Tax=Dietzia aerolata TaxID=595984 RepID=UPI0036338DD4